MFEKFKNLTTKEKVSYILGIILFLEFTRHPYQMLIYDIDDRY